MVFEQCLCGGTIHGETGEICCDECGTCYYCIYCTKCNNEILLNEQSNNNQIFCDNCWEKAENIRNNRLTSEDFAIIRNPSIFTNGLTDEYPISYRLVILNILNKMILKSINSNEIKNNLNSLLTAISNNQEHQFIEYNDFVEIYTFKNISSKNEIFAILIDKTKGTYPLFFYSKSSGIGKKGYRVDALQSSLENIINNFENLLNELNEINTDNILENTEYKNRLCALLENWAQDPLNT